MAHSQFNLSELKSTSQQEPQINEVMPVSLPKGITQIVAKLLNGDINFNWSGDAKTKSFTVEERNRFRLFNKPIESLLIERQMHPDPEAATIANILLRSEEKEVSQALDLIKIKLTKDPAYLDFAIEAVDHLQRKVKGTLLQIVAMAADVVSVDGIENEEEHGLVERLAIMGKLSTEEITSQLQIITSHEAKRANEKRNQRILNAVKRFGEELLVKWKEFEETMLDTSEGPALKNLSIESKQYLNRMLGPSRPRYKMRLEDFCKPIIDELNATLISNETITSGFIFDLAILRETVKWLEENMKDFDAKRRLPGNLYSRCVVEPLRAKLSMRDIQVVGEPFAILYHQESPPRDLEPRYRFLLDYKRDFGSVSNPLSLFCTQRDSQMKLIPSKVNNIDRQRKLLPSKINDTLQSGAQELINRSNEWKKMVDAYSKQEKCCLIM